MRFGGKTCPNQGRSSLLGSAWARAWPIAHGLTMGVLSHLAFFNQENKNLRKLTAFFSSDPFTGNRKLDCHDSKKNVWQSVFRFMQCLTVVELQKASSVSSGKTCHEELGQWVLPHVYPAPNQAPLEFSLLSFLLDSSFTHHICSRLDSPNNFPFFPKHFYYLIVHSFKLFESLLCARQWVRH